MQAPRLVAATLAVVFSACSSPVPPSPSPTPAPVMPTNAPASTASSPAPPSGTPALTPPPKVVGDLELEQCDPEGLLPCDHQAVVLVEPVAASGVFLTYSTEWADGRTDRPNWNASALGLGGWSLDVLQRYDPEHGILLSGDGSWRIAETVDVGDNERAVPTFDGFQYFVFDAQWRHVRTVDSVTGAAVLTFSYDDAGRLAGVSGQVGRNIVAVTVERETDGTAGALVGLEDVRTGLVPDPQGRLGTVAHPDGTSLSVTLSEFGLVRSWQTTGRGAVEYEYDEAGRLTRTTDADGVTVAFSFDAADGAVSVTSTDATGGTAVLRAERAGEVLRRTFTDADGTVTQLETNADGSTRLMEADGTVTTTGIVPHPRWGLAAPVLTPFVETRQDGTEYRVETTTTMGTGSPEPAGLAWQTEYTINGDREIDSYDPATRTVTRVDSVGRESSVAFDDRARVVAERLIGQPPVVYAYDASGRLVSTTVGEGESAATTSYAYTAEAGEIVVTRPDGTSVRSSFDAFGNVLRAATDEENVALVRDATGSVLQVRPGQHPATSFGYSEAGRETAFIPPAVGDDMSYEMTTYTASGQVAAIQGPGDRLIEVTYDAAGRATSWSFDRGTSTATYAAETGLLASNTSPDGVTTSFDYNGWVATGLAWGGPVSGEVRLTIDGLLRPVAEMVNGAEEIEFSYDAGGLLTAIGPVAVERDADSGLATSTSLAEVEITHEYDANGRLLATIASSGGEQVAALRYTRDLLGRVVSVERTDVDGSASSTAYTYDSTGRISTVQTGDTRETYEYDASGNPVSVTSGEPAGVMTASYDDRDRLVTRGDESYRYEPDGTLLETSGPGGVTTYDFDDLGALRAVVLPDGRRIDYVIDAGGRRIGRMVDGVLTDGYLYGVDDSIVAWTDGAGEIIARFAYDDLGRLALVRRDGRDLLVVTDELGSPIALLDSQTGEVAQAVTYDTWGNVVAESGPILTPFGFAGGLADPDTRLVHFGARDYDPITARWTSLDPLRFAGGDANLYRYAMGDPVNLIDPTGTTACSPTSCGASGRAGPVFRRTAGGAGGVAAGTGRGVARPYHDAGPSKVVVDVGPAVIDTGGTSVEIGPAVIDPGGGTGVEIGPAVIEQGGGTQVTIGPARIERPGGAGGVSRPGSGKVGGGSAGSKAGSGAAGAKAGGGSAAAKKGGTPPAGKGGKGGGAKAPGRPNRPASSGNCLAPGICVPANQSTYPGRGAPDSVNRPDKPEGLGSPNVFGEPHVVTADGQHLDFQAAGEFVIAQSADAALKIQARFETPPNITNVTRTTAVAMQVAGDRVGLYTDPGRMTINGQVVDRSDYGTTLAGGGVVERHGTEVAITWPDGSVFWAHIYARFINFGLTPSAAIAPGLVGVFGSFDGNKSNDVSTRDGLVLDPEDPSFPESLYTQFANSWRITQEEALFDYEAGESTATFTRPEIPSSPATVDSLSEQTRTQAEALCRAVGVTSEPILSDCILDFGLTGDPTYVASAITVDAAVERTGAVAVDFGTGIELDRPVTGQLAAGATDRYHFTAQAGDVVYIDAAEACDSALDWRLLRPDGGAVWFDRTCVDLGRRVLTVAGEWRLEIYSDEQAPGAYSFTVLSVPQPSERAIAPGESASGATTAVGEWHRYTLNASAGQVIYLDAESCEGDLSWRLLRPDAGLVDFQLACVDLGRRVLDEAGTWVIEIYSDDMDTGSYAFRVIDVPAAEERAMEIGQHVAGATTQIGEWHRYRVSATPEQIVYFDAQGECQPGMYWRLLRPDGGLSTFATTCQDLGRRILDVEGDWVIEIYADELATGAYSFTMIAVPAVRENAVTLGQSVSGTIGSVGEWHRYTLSAQPGQTIVVDGQGDCVADLWWRLLAPDGSLKTFASTCADSSPIAIDVAGDWVVEIYSDTMATGAYTFTVNLAS